jgi:hypothetical protein
LPYFVRVVYVVSLVLFWYLDEGLRAVDFAIMKNPTASGANPRSWVPEASTLTPRPPKPLIRSPDRPARNQSLYRLSYPAHTKVVNWNFKVVLSESVRHLTSTVMM